MKLSYYFILIFIFSFSIAKGTTLNTEDYQQQCKISGKIQNYDSTVPLIILVNRVGMINENIPILIDETGNFNGEFETEVPLDVWISYRANFLVQLNPRDSIFIRFDGQMLNRPELLKSVYFSGTNAETNYFIAKFQEIYYASDLYNNRNRKENAFKNYNHQQFSLYNDSVYQESAALYAKFIKEYNPNEESKNWANFFSRSDYLSNIGWYMYNHRSYNALSLFDKLEIPLDFWDPLLDIFPIDRAHLKNAYNLNEIINTVKNYSIECLRDKWSSNKNDDTDWGFLPSGILGGGDSNKLDSLELYSAIAYIPDTLMKEISIMSIINKDLDEQKITTYQTYQKTLQKEISSIYFRNLLHKKYLKVKSNLENPKFNTETILKDYSNKNSTNLLKEIIDTNDGKVIYVDLWATWCGPCISEMPNSKAIEAEFDKKNVSFVYIAVHSEEATAKAKVAEMQMGGQHYFLNSIQSNQLFQALGVKAIPHYIIIDQQGEIVHSGNHVRPNQAKPIIKELLNEDN